MFRRPFNPFYAEPPRSTNTIMPSSLPSSPVITISLSSNKCSDRRTITLHPGEDVIIGRASRSEIKNLQASPDNALFDCPVVSRAHAELRASIDGNQVRITDRSSLHGTTVNGQRLSPHMPFTLQSGDEIKLGERVTRGDDSHDGISLTFRRISTSASNMRSSSPARGFSVPSPSDPEGSDDESDSESIQSFRYDDDSSTKTTPEQPKTSKPAMGSQQDPIDLDYLPLARSDVVVLDVDEEEQERHVPETAQEEAPEMSSPQQHDADEETESIHPYNTGLSQILNERAGEEDDDVDFTADPEDYIDESIDDADNLSDSAASDLSDAAPLHPGSFSNNEWTTHRPISPELGDEEHGNVQPSHYSPTSPVIGSPPCTRYDPVRDLQPPSETRPAPISTYTYGPFGFEIPPAPATDFLASSRWDVPPQPYGPSYNATTVVPPHNFPLSYGTDPNFNRFAPPPPPPSNALFAKSDIAMKEPLREVPRSAAPKPMNLVEVAVPSASGVKRKASDEDQETPAEAETVHPEAKRHKSEAVEVAPKPRTHRRRSGKRHGTVRRLAGHAASAAVGTAIGGLGMIAFLNSNLSQSLIDWLA